MIGVIILNYNSWHLTVDCIKSIYESCYINYRIFIVDNNSTIEMPDYFKEFIKSEKIEYIQALKNKGYSAGNNLGIKKALEFGCNYILISNSDIVFHDKSIEKMKNYLEQNKNVGIVGPKVFLSSGNIQDVDMLIKTTLKIKYKNILIKTPLKSVFNLENNFSKNKEELDYPFKVHSVSGCCFMMTREVTEKLYPLDEIPFLYEEEVILGVQMEKMGLDTIYLTKAEVTHLHGQTTKNLKAFSYIEFVRSEIYYLKHYLNKNNLQLVPLVTIRLLKYSKNCLTSKEYREYFTSFFYRGLEFMKKDSFNNLHYEE